MHRPGLEWAQRLHGELVVRIEGLRAALADIEPLREELVRLEEQLRGVERLLHVYRSQLGPAALDEPKEEEVKRPAPAEQPVRAPVTAPPLWSYEPSADAPRMTIRQTLRQAASGLKATAARAWLANRRAWLAAREWIAKRLPHSARP